MMCLLYVLQMDLHICINILNVILWSFEIYERISQSSFAERCSKLEYNIPSTTKTQQNKPLSK
jgi:hypothetical protein